MSPADIIVASNRVKSALVVLGVSIALSMLAMMGVIAALDERAATLATERERTQIINGLNLQLARLRGDLTSVTFWDEAVQRTAVAFDQPWVDENIGHWLARFYGADMSFVLNPKGAPVYASIKDKRANLASFNVLASVVGPLRSQVLTKLRSYKSTNPDAAYNIIDPTHARGFDAARLVVIEGRPMFVIVAPILPDFGRAGASPANYHLLVAVYDIDEAFLAQLGQSLLIDRLALVLPPAAENLPSLRGRPHNPILLQWQPHRTFGYLLADVLPLALLVFCALLAASLLILYFARRAVRELIIMWHVAMHDELTGLANRRLFMRTLDQALEQYDASTPLALLFIDLDRFKEINDLWGHQIGDAVLRASMRRISEVVSEDAVARLGGDEFTVILRHSQAFTLGIARKILARLRRPHDIDGLRLVSTGSIGIAFASGSSVTASELLRHADLALYRAKELGRDRWMVFKPEMDSEAPVGRRSEGDQQSAA